MSESESELTTSGTNQSQSPLSGLPSTDVEHVLQPSLLRLTPPIPRLWTLLLNAPLSCSLCLLHGEIDNSAASQSGVVFNMNTLLMPSTSPVALVRKPLKLGCSESCFRPFDPLAL
ncbi:hypothetical protein AHAS_Ahas11G0214900 [Arachis hypogaea]